jgi:hypothetical protein
MMGVKDGFVDVEHDGILLLTFADGVDEPSRANILELSMDDVNCCWRHFLAPLQFIIDD